MRKTVPSHVLAALSPNAADVEGAKTKPSRRKRAVKSKVHSSPAFDTAFDRLARALQPALDDIDAAWA
ncbi:hypothetical protein LZC95_16580 [Pendulispora brunnea]|uniref:Uncharacterized protein n=1 Tax=Pendulispora brunnea TaxID=2905690 RepID=A0ABZ2KIQ6_9BACT